MTATRFPKPAPLAKIATVRMGVTLRGRDATRPTESGACQLIRITDLTDDGTLTSRDLLRFAPPEAIKPEHFLRPGDVLFPNRGTRLCAHAFDRTDGDVLAGAQFFVIRSDGTRVDPAYLAWALRGSAAAAHFEQRRKGSLVQTMQRRDVEEFPVPLPPLTVQRTIFAAHRLAVEERELVSRLSDLRGTLVEYRLLHAATAST